MLKHSFVTITLLSLGCVASHAASYAGIISNDNVLQGNFEVVAPSTFLLNNSNRDRVGTGGNSGQQRVNQPVLGFILPTIDLGETITSVKFSFDMTTTAAITGAPLGFDMVVSLMNQTTIGGFTGADFLEATAAVNSSLGNGIVIGQFASADVGDNDTVEITLTGAALTQFSSL